MKQTLLFIALWLSVAMQAQVLYGLTETSDTGSGTLFSYNLKAPKINTERKFRPAEDGTYAYGSLVQTSNGKLYGLTRNGGTQNKGTLFQYEPATKTYTVRYHFGSTAGDVAFLDFRGNGSLIEASNKKLYGLSSNAVFEYNPAENSYAVKAMLSSIGGSEAYGELTELNCKLYGMTKSGGAQQLGIIFEYDLATGTIIKKVDFNRTNGARPTGKLTAYSGKLYGITPDGGTGFGNLFEYDPVTDTLTNKINFGSANGFGPGGFLTLAKNNKLYGTTVRGGAFNLGFVFEFDPATGVFTQKAPFGNDGDDAWSCEGGLLEASNGMFNGLTRYINNPDNEDDPRGSLFQWDPAANKIKRLEYFDGPNGLQVRGRLIELKDASGLATAETAEANVAVYPNPVSDVLFLKGISKATVKIYSMAGQLLQSETISNGQLNVSRLSKGLYLVKVEAGGKTTTHKVVKQ